MSPALRTSLAFALVVLTCLGLAACGSGDDAGGLLAACGNGLIESGLVCFAATGTDVPVAPLPARIAFGDFNGDSRPDLAVATIGAPASNTTVMLNQGAGAFTAANLGAIPSGGAGVAIGFLNGDSNRDIVRGTASGGVLSFGLGNGTFAPGGPSFVSPASTVNQIEIARLDGDSDTDLILIGGTQLVSAANDGSGNFAPLAFGAVGTLSGLAVADFNGDAFSDAAVLESGGGGENLRIALCNGLGSLAVPTTIVLPFTAAGSSVAGDLDGDGDPDLVVVAQFSNQALVALNIGGGAFLLGSPFNVGSDPTACQLADFDGDGRLDLAIALFSGTAVEIRLGDGAGNFGAATVVNLGGDRPNHLVVPDVNGDLARDLILPLGATDEVRTILATP